MKTIKSVNLSKQLVADVAEESKKQHRSFSMTVELLLRKALKSNKESK